jgi:uncharacterized protein YhfF
VKPGSPSPEPGAVWDSPEEMWAAFKAVRGLDDRAVYSAWHFCDNQADADELASLVARGIKRATAGALWAYEAEGEALPRVGAYNVITDWEGRPRAVVRTVGVEVVPFGEVSPEFAAAEGEGDLSLAYWRRAHWAAFSRELAGIGRQPSEDMPVVCERFEVEFVAAN